MGRGGLSGAGELIEALSPHIERLAAAIQRAAADGSDWSGRVSVGLAAGLELLAAEPALARLLLVEAPADASTRPEYEQALTRLADALRVRAADSGGGEGIPLEHARLLAGGLVSYLSRRVLAGEAEQLPDAHAFLLEYLLTP